MASRFNRREFSVGTTALMTGLALNSNGSADTGRLSAGTKLMTLGINAMARAHEMNYFADGHRGAALISAQLMCTNNKFDDVATSRIVELFDLNWAKSKLCKPFPNKDPAKNAVEKVGKALADGGGVLRQVGHDAIFAMHAIKVFRTLPKTATPERVEGVCKLIRSFKPWRDVKPDEKIKPPLFSDETAASRFILKEASNTIDKFIGFGQGYAGHMLTFGQSLVELASMGDEEWAESCRTAFCKYVTVSRMGPQTGDRKIKAHKFSKLRPADTEYWKRRGNKSLGLGHVFKYPYAYYDLLARAKDPELEKEFNAKAWRLF